MALIVCKDCGAPASDQASVCPRCGRPLLGAAIGAGKKGGPGGGHGLAVGVATALVSLGLLVLSMILGKAMNRRNRW